MSTSVFITFILCATGVFGAGFWSYTLKDVIASCDRIGGAGWCTKVMGTYEKVVYKVYGPSKNPLCVEDPIQRCTCIEMLFRTTSLTPSFPNIDDEDVRKLFRRSSEKYHPQNTQQGSAKSFLFLQKCADAFSVPFLRKEYLKRIKSRLQDCKDDGISDEKCRNGILRRHKQFFEEYKDVKKYAPEEYQMYYDKIYAENVPLLKARQSVERLFVYLDDSGSMTGNGTMRGKEFLKNIQNRLMDTPSNIHFIGSKSVDTGSRLMIDAGSINMTETILSSEIMDKWNGDSGWTFMWEYIWDTMKNESVQDSEILIVTDGMDNESSGKFEGTEGFNELMMKIKESKQVLCRVFVYCVSDECKEEVRKSSKSQSTYIDLAWVTGGFYCDDENAAHCQEMMTATHYTRTKMANVTKGEHLKMIAEGKAKMLPFEDNKILKMVDPNNKDEL